MFSGVPFMYGRVAVVVGVTLSLVHRVVRSVSVSSDELFFVDVLWKNTIKVLILNN